MSATKYQEQQPLHPSPQHIGEGEWGSRLCRKIATTEEIECFDLAKSAQYNSAKFNILWCVLAKSLRQIEKTPPRSMGMEVESVSKRVEPDSGSIIVCHAERQFAGFDE